MRGREWARYPLLRVRCRGQNANGSNEDKSAERDERDKTTHSANLLNERKMVFTGTRVVLIEGGAVSCAPRR